MKTEKDKLIDFVKEVANDIYDRVSPALKEDARLLLESINPQNETDRHRILEDNKAQKEVCPECGSSLLYLDGQNPICCAIDCRYEKTD